MKFWIQVYIFSLGYVFPGILLKSYIMFDNHIFIMLSWVLIKFIAISYLQRAFLGLKVLVQLEFTCGWSF